MTRIVFFGTPEEAVPALEAVAERHEVSLVITRADRPRGRKGRPQPPPVKEAATGLGIPFAQPETRAGIVEALRDHGPFDLGVVVAYGRILPPEVLEVPRQGMLNLHFSLLPRWRGAAPVARALMAGDRMTGVTIIQLDEGLDTGPVLTAQLVDVHPAETSGSLTARLAAIGARLLVSVIPGYTSGEVVPVPQSDDGVTFADKITAEDRNLDNVTDPAEFVARVRGLAPRPGAVLTLDGQPHQIHAARSVDVSVEIGKWVSVEGHPVVGLAGGAVAVVTIQPPGKRPMGGDAWLRGVRRAEGSAGGGHTIA
jgi:methionyl-tRNA formyltransferase